MDGQRFDNLTRRLATATSRRGLLKGLGGTLIGGMAASLGIDQASARVTQASCGNVVCGDDPGVCNDGCVCCVWGNGNSRCMPPRDCRRARGDVAEPCDDDLTRCNGECIDTTADTANCGECGATCPTDPNGTTTCIDSTCGITCNDPYTWDGSACVTEPECDVANCAGGSNACEVAACIENDCALVAAEVGTPCREASTACEVAATCTGESTTCPPNGTADDNAPCDGGKCCGGTCTDTQTDLDHCGTCANSCPEVENGQRTCVDGECRFTCNSGYISNGSACVPVQSCQNPSDCPGGSNPCQDRTCIDNVCGYAPAPSTTVCHASTGPCDPRQFCDGSTMTCPTDSRASDGDSCGTDQVCCNGVCCDAGDTCAETGCTPPSSGNCESTVCAATDQCHYPGFCNDATGECTNPPAPDGILCDFAGSCATEGVCSDGACICRTTGCACQSEPTTCHIGVCTNEGTCPRVPSPNGTPCGTDQICCDGECCQADYVCTAEGCSAGALCPPGKCDDLNTQCAVGSCNPTNGICSAQPRYSGGVTPVCLAPDPCHNNGYCSGTQCVSTEKDCSDLNDTCNVGTCDGTTGVCVKTPANGGASCTPESTNPCVTSYTCQEGSCAPASYKSCDQPGDCQIGPGTCNSTNGVCEYPSRDNNSVCPSGFGFCCNGVCCNQGERTCDSTFGCTG